MIHLQRQYSAARELESFMEAQPEDEPMDDAAKVTSMHCVRDERMRRN